MDIIKQHIATPQTKNPVELIILALHTFILEEKFNIVIPHGDSLNKSTGLPKRFNENPNEWYIGYERNDLSTKLQVIWAIWGDKILVTLEEWGFAPSAEDSEKMTMQRVKFFQFGVNLKNYVHLDSLNEASWDDLENPSQLHEMHVNFVSAFIEEMSVKDISVNGIHGLKPRDAAMIGLAIAIAFASIVAFNFVKHHRTTAKES